MESTHMNNHPTMSLQLQSPLISLPGELRNQIFELSMITDLPITNPSRKPLANRPQTTQIPALSIALARTCRALHTELDLYPVFHHNTFVFTRASHIHDFYRALTREQTRWNRRITIDLREAATAAGEDAESNNVENEWLHYFTCNRYAHPAGVWCSELSTLGSDLPDLKELILDLSGWQSPFAGLRRGGWAYLQKLLGSLTGLDSVAIKGRCLSSKAWNPVPAPWGVGPWFSPAYSCDETSLLKLLGGVVRIEGVGEEKVYSWSVQDGVSTLEVKVLSKPARDLVDVSSFGRKFPENGVAAWNSFVEQNSHREEEEAAEKMVLDH